MVQENATMAKMSSGEFEIDIDESLCTRSSKHRFAWKTIAITAPHPDRTGNCTSLALHGAHVVMMYRNVELSENVRRKICDEVDSDKEHSPGETLTWGNVMDRNLPHLVGIRTVLQGIDLRGKTIAITGTTSGIGLETARSLALHGAHVVMMNRNVELSENVRRKICDEVDSDKEHSPGETLTWGNVMDRNLPHLVGIRTVPIFFPHAARKIVSLIRIIGFLQGKCEKIRLV
ncbi:short chain dehydrogenase domain-containing protein [Ditylenchus destructor]|uniref:Short chain dehydrogenase domain-containing protein n=1 Tax=Ditylenchus destructor TaxID=166010 RepID=A0AAD4QVQ2_9BILA|nr:short chain dehydrogenase domain-containing protein [Ditylenchus destructor]